MFIFNNLPNDIQAKILSYLTMHKLHACYNVFSYNTLFHSIKIRLNYLDDTIVKGTINNLAKRCFKCSKPLTNIYNLLLCGVCLIITDRDSIHYPEICQECTKIKIERGKTRFLDCIICKKHSTFLGISVFS